METGASNMPNGRIRKICHPMLRLPTLATNMPRIHSDTIMPTSLLLMIRSVKLSDAFIYSFYPGPVGGLALAEILKGIVNPSGRLPASLPESSGQLPVYYNYKASYRAVKYMDKQEGPLYSFGYGLDYTDYAYENIGLNKTHT